MYLILVVLIINLHFFSRLENTQYAASNGVKDESASCTDVPASSAGSWPDGRKGVKDEKISE